MQKPVQIAIDGPSGAGKSTVAKMLAQSLGFIYIDTGAMYRALALYFTRKGIGPGDAAAVSEGLAGVKIDFTPEGCTLLNGEDVSGAIRVHAVSKAASDFSALPAVRAYLVAAQQEMAEKAGCVLDGRDIGTHVLPHAPYKFFLTADARVRANRRYKELLARGEEADEEKVLADILQRDHNDATRACAPLRQAEDAVLIDSSCLSQQEVLAVMQKKVLQNV